MSKNWIHYEAQIFSDLKTKFPRTKMTRNAKIIGISSKRSRQIDILIEGKLTGIPIIGVVECKLFNRKVHVKDIESFISFLEDVGANLGIMITNKGYTISAEKRVAGISHKIRLHKVKFKHLHAYDFGWDSCPSCALSNKMSLSEIIWGDSQKLGFGRKKISIKLGQCEYCGDENFKCENCSTVLDFIDDKFAECNCGVTFQKEQVNIGNGMSGQEVTIFSIPRKK